MLEMEHRKTGKKANRIRLAIKIYKMPISPKEKSMVLKVTVRRISPIIYMLYFFCIVSCATNQAVKKNQADALRLVGEAYMAQGNYTLALGELLKAEKLYQKDHFLHLDLGLVYIEKKELDLAVDHFKKALKIKPDFAQALNNLGIAYLFKEDWDQAIDCFKELNNDLLNTTPHFPLTNLGFAYYHKKDYPLAEKYFLEALKIEPNFDLALRGLGNNYVAMGRISEAVEVFERAIRYSPRFPQLYFDLAHAYGLLNQNSKAIYTYEKVIELAPDTPLADEAKKELEKIK